MSAFFVGAWGICSAVLEAHRVERDKVMFELFLLVSEGQPDDRIGPAAQDLNLARLLPRLLWLFDRLLAAVM